MLTALPKDARVWMSRLVGYVAHTLLLQLYKNGPSPIVHAVRVEVHV